MTNKVSFCIVTYNQQEYIREAIQGALAQQYSALEIIISDDNSTDKTFDVITETVKDYKGEHTIIVNRNEVNLGLGAHFSKICREIASGDYIVVLGGDDISEPEHVSSAVSLLDQNPKIMLADCSANYINSQGELLDYKNTFDWDESFYYLRDYLSLKKILSFAPGRIFRRELMTGFNPIANNCPTEDSVLVLRSLLTGGMMRSNKILVNYRRHDENISSKTSKLSNLAIVSQYLKDVLYLFDTGMITEKDTEIVISRIMTELEIRAHRYKDYSNFIDKLFSVLSLKWFLLKKKYKYNKFAKFELSKKPVL